MSFMKSLCSFVFLCQLVWSLEAAHQAVNLKSSVGAPRGPAWMSVSLRADANLLLGLPSGTVTSSDNGTGNILVDQWSIASGELLWKTGSLWNSANVMNELLAAQRFEVTPELSEHHFVYTFPQNILEMSKAELKFSVAFMTSSNLLVGPLEADMGIVDIEALREKHWTRTAPGPGGTWTISTYSPGSYLTYDFFGSGLKAWLGEALNMGQIKVELDGEVLMPALDLFPDDISVDANPQSTPNTRFTQRRLMEPELEDAQHRLKLTLLEERHPQALDSGFALTGFTVERFVNNSGAIYESDITVDGQAKILLHSQPTPFDANLLVGQLNMGANLLALIQTSSNTSSNTSSGNTSGNIAVEVLPATDTGNNVTVAKASRAKGVSLNGDHLHLKVSTGDKAQTVLLDDWQGVDLPVLRWDELHRIDMQTVTVLGQAGSVKTHYHFPISKPWLWKVGETLMSFDIGDEHFTLTRERSDELWLVTATTTKDAILGIEGGQPLIVVQKANALGPVDFEVSGPLAEYLDASGNTQRLASTRWSGTNFISYKPLPNEAAISASPEPLAPSTASPAGTDGSSNASEGIASPAASSGGGGGGCLLQP